MEMVVAITIVTLAWLFWNHVRYVLPVKLRFSATGKKLPPGIMGIPFFGEMLTFLWYFKFLRQPDEYINSKRRKYGNEAELYRTHLFGKPSIIVCSPEANKLVLQSDEIFLREWPSVELMGTTSLIAVHGDAHDRIRSFLLRGINTPDSLRQIALMIQPRIISSLDLWAKKGRIIVYDEVKKVTLENIGKYFVGFEPGSHLDTIAECFKGMVAGFRAYPINFPGTTYYEALQCRKKVTQIFTKEMEHKKKFQNAKNDLMQGLMQMKDEDGNKLRDIEVVDNIVTLVIGGHEPSVVAITWAFYNLAKHPNVLKKLREEHLNIASQKQNGDYITYDDILTCKYTIKVVDETLRLANIGFFVFRTATKDVEYKGYTIPKGWKAICWLRHLHMNPENYDDPLCFNPDRWNELPKPGTKLPFGRGSRSCPGNMLVHLQISIILHHLVIGYRWELVNPDAKMIYLPHPRPEDGVEIDICKI